LVDYRQFEEVPAEEVLSWAISTYGDSFAIATSFQKEGMVIVDMAARLRNGVHVFTLDTGRLPRETHVMIELLRHRYGIAAEVVHPDPDEVAEMVAARGANLFYDSVESRRLCCDIRKVRPLQRKLAGLQAWASGLRREQSAERAAVPKVSMVEGRIKVNPVADWTAAQIEAYLARYDVPVHPLYARGFASLGCEPCTRALQPGESGRAGRWWWEADEKKECGIHIAADGLVKRA
jgi:phosphoadenosine phosphosulfate reductase